MTIPNPLVFQDILRGVMTSLPAAPTALSSVSMGTGWMALVVMLDFKKISAKEGHSWMLQIWVWWTSSVIGMMSPDVVKPWISAGGSVPLREVIAGRLVFKN